MINFIILKIKKLIFKTNFAGSVTLFQNTLKYFLKKKKILLSDFFF